MALYNYSFNVIFYESQILQKQSLYQATVPSLCTCKTNLTYLTDSLLVFLQQAVTESDLNIRTYAGNKRIPVKRTHLTLLLTRFINQCCLFLFSVGFRNHAATDPSCYSNKLLQQMDEGRRLQAVYDIRVLVIYLPCASLGTSVACFLILS